MDIERVVLIVLDGVGIGDAPDAAEYGDEGSNTLANVAARARRLSLPNLGSLGLGRLAAIEGVPPEACPKGAFGRMRERSAGKDTTTGHWEIAGIWLEKPFPTYPGGFPPDVIRAFEERIGRRTLGNKVASGTQIIAELGEEHMRTGRPIVYTSADSVFQIAAHERVVPLDELYRICAAARELLVGEHGVGRVIARPFDGEPGSFFRTAGRRDFSLPPPEPTLLDLLTECGIFVAAVGKVSDIFAGRGIGQSVPAKDNDQVLDAVLELLVEAPPGSLIFANCNDFDSVYGHRNDAAGFARALEAFDARLPGILSRLGERDIAILTADHGCDPTTPSTDHSREMTPLLLFGAPIRPGTDLGTRDTYSDVAATVAEAFGVPAPERGRSFWRDVRL